MKVALKNKLQQKLANSEGFTLLEILVVLTIMGFLIAMVAPRLAGIADDAVGTVCDTSQSRMIQNTAVWWQAKHSYPNNMTNLVDHIADTAAGYQIPAVVDGDPDNGQETFAAEFIERAPLFVHYLNKDEVKELKKLGIVKVLDLNAYDAYDPDDSDAIKKDSNGTAYAPQNIGGYTAALGALTKRYPAYDPVVLKEGSAVAMIGMGAKTAAGNIDVIAPQIRGWGEEDFQGRIILGFGPENEMITSGLVANAAHCPGGIQDEANVSYNDYNLVLPRLDATVGRIPDTNFYVTGYTAVSYDDESELGTGETYDVGTGTQKVRTGLKLEAMEAYQYATVCPEGHKFPADEGEYWAIVADGDGTTAATVGKNGDPIAMP